MFLFFTVYGSFFVTCCHGWLVEVCERDHCFPIRHRLFPLERFCDFFCPVLPDKRKRKITGSKSENIRIFQRSCCSRKFVHKKCLLKTCQIKKLQQARLALPKTLLLAHFCFQISCLGRPILLFSLLVRAWAAAAAAAAQLDIQALKHAAICLFGRHCLTSLLLGVPIFCSLRQFRVATNKKC